MSTILRYDCEIEFDKRNDGYVTQIELETGPYVLFSDHEKAMSEKQELFHAMVNKLRGAEAALAEVAAERDALARWKAEYLIVESWWHSVDKAVRKHPEALMGRTVAGTALRLIEERDEFKKLSEGAISVAQKCQEFYPRPSQPTDL